MAAKKPDLFKSLKLKFILTATLSSVLVLIAAFGSIYLIVSGSMNNRIPLPENRLDERAFDENANQYFEERLHEDRAASLKVLLSSLIIAGAAVELVVFLASIYLAEQAVRPVREAYEAQKSFIANASHEIKTPLAVIAANLEAADIQGNHWIDNVSEKVEDLTALNNQLLALARTETLPEKIETEAIEPEKTVRNTVDFYLPKAKKQGIKVTVKAEAGAKKTRELNRAELVQILNILIDNAVKYAAKKITVTISRDQFTIKNDGATIAREDLPHIFDRFYQTDKTSAGVGLGLAIAKQIAAHNKWKLTADSDEGSTTFTLEF